MKIVVGERAMCHINVYIKHIGDYFLESVYMDYDRSYQTHHTTAKSDPKKG